MEATVPHMKKGHTISAMIERHDVCARNLPQGLVVGRSLVTIDEKGRVPVQVANFSDKDLLMKSKTWLGYAKPASANGVKLVDIGENEVRVEMEEPYSHVDANDILDRMSIGEISSDQKQRIKALISLHNNVFSLDEYDVGVCRDIEHEINLTDDKPVTLPYKRVPPKQWNEVREYLRKVMEKNIIRESCSPYASPVVLARKAIGELHLCVDYRKLNAKTSKHAYPLPKIDDALESLKGAKYFSTLDLAHGFHQIRVREKDIQKTAFRVGTGGLYEFVRMPFGLCNAPATFMRMMDKAFGDENFQTILIYLDDILIPAKSFTEMLSRLDMVFNRLEKFGLKVKPEKCHLFKPKIRFLGHVVSEDGIATDPDKICAITEWKVPETVEELRSFMGLCGYYRKFIENYAKIVRPLHSLCNTTKGKTKLLWTEDCNNAFETLKTKLSTTPVLGYPDFNEEFCLEIDASFNGLGAVLSQRQDGKTVVVAYASRGLRRHERNMNIYSSMKLELLALYWAVTVKFRDILIGSQFVGFTDNNPLSYVNSSAKIGATDEMGGRSSIV